MPVQQRPRRAAGRAARQDAEVPARGGLELERRDVRDEVAEVVARRDGRDPD